MSTVDAISMLNRLVVVAKDGQAALKAAAEEVYHEDLQRALMEFSEFFGDAADELQAAVRGLGGHPKGLGTFANTLHRTWMHLKAAALGRDETVILDAIETDEALGEQMLAEAVQWGTPPPVHAMLVRLHQGARERHDVIRRIRAQLAETA